MVRLPGRMYLVLLALALVATPVWAVTFVGSLSTGDGMLVGSSHWGSGTSLAYSVSRGATDEYWHYTYTFTAAQHGLSNIIFEVSEGSDPFTHENLFNASDAVESDGIKLYGPSPSTPGLTSTFYGAKFEINYEPGGTPRVYVIQFDSDRMPMWGDFYAKNGQTQVYNAGMAELNPGVDPGLMEKLTWGMDAGHDLTVVDMASLYTIGSLQRRHLLVPDTLVFPPPPIPEPLTVTALLLSAAGLGRYLRRRSAL